MATLMTGSGNVMFSSLIGAVGRGQRVAGDDLLDADGRGDVARVDLLDLLAVVGVHHQDAPDALGPARRHVEHARARLELARVDAEVGELADEGVGRDLEGERRERLGVVGVAHGRAVLLALDGLEALDRRHVERARQEVDDRVEQRLDALVLERRAAQHRRQLDLERRLADRRDQELRRDLGLLEDQLDELVVVVGDLLEQVLARGGGGVAMRSGISTTSISLPSSSL